MNSETQAKFRTAAKDFRNRRKALGKIYVLAKGGYILFVDGLAVARIAGLNTKYKGNPYYPCGAIVVPDDGSPMYQNKRTPIEGVDHWEAL